MDDDMTRTAVAVARMRIVELLSHFMSGSASDWDGWEHGSDLEFLELLQLDLTMLSLAVERRRQVLGGSVQDFGS